MQETLFILKWLSGFFDAEGCVRVNKSVRKNYTTYSPRLSIVNSDFDTVEYIVTFLSKLGINHYVQTRKKTGNRTITKVIEINRITKVFDLCLLLSNHSITKKEEIDLLRQFCYSRMSKLDGIVKGRKNPYSSEEVDIYKKLIVYKVHKKRKKCLSYKPRDMDLVLSIDAEWLAGFVDGDGSMNINNRGTPSWSVGTTHPPTFNSIKAFLDRLGIYYYQTSNLPAKNHLENCKLRCYKIFVNNPKGIITVIETIKPFLFTKKQQAELLLEFCNLRLKKKYQRLNEKEKDLIREILILNRRGSLRDYT